jgi:endonuclease YncB( thermonuclease family)
LKAPEKTTKDLFTYQASVLRVVDGDTLYVEIDLGFGITIEQYLRLRGIDAPEINTKAGKRAALFVKNELKDAPFIILQSSRSDRWDRYLADVFYTVNGSTKGGSASGGEERYLNNFLLLHGLAKRIDF